MVVRVADYLPRKAPEPTTDLGGAKAPHALCSICPLAPYRCVRSNGPERADIAILGESPGQNELREGRGFVGDSGKLLDRMLPLIDVDRRECLVTNTVLCDVSRVDKQEILDEAIACCRPRLIHELQQRGVKRVYAFGAWAVHAMDGSHDSMAKRAGKRFVTQEGFEVCPTYHPAYVLRTPDSLLDVVSDLERFQRPKLVNGAPVADHHVVTSLDELLQCEADVLPCDVLVLDLETDGFDARHDKILCLALCGRDDRTWVIPEAIILEHRDVVLRILHQQHIWVGHNFKFDAKFCYTNLGYTPTFGFDTLLADHALHERTWGHSLKEAAMREFELTYDYEVEIEHVLRQQGLNPRTASYRNVPPDILHRYAGYDVWYTLALYRLLRPRLEEEGLMDLMNNLLAPAQQALMHVELAGVLVDMEYYDQLRKDCAREIASLIVQMRRLTGNPDFNPYSTPQVDKFLFDELSLDRPKLGGAAKGRKFMNSKTGKAVLEALGDDLHPFIPLMKRFRKQMKLFGTYFKMDIDDDGRIRPDFFMSGTVTGRIATKKLVNIPRGDTVRNMFTAPPGWVLVQADYSQAELRVAAVESGDEFMIQIFRDDRDVHGEVARALFGDGYTKEDRMLAKNFNFGVVYSGCDYHAIAFNLNRPIAQIAEIGDRYFGKMPKLRVWIDDLKAFLMQNGYVASPVYGRRRRFPLITPVFQRRIFNEAINHPCQAAASDLTLMALTTLQNRPDFPGRILLMVHDSIICEVPEEALGVALPMLKETMEQMPSRIMNTEVPFKADISVGTHWGNLKDVKV